MTPRAAGSARPGRDCGGAAPLCQSACCRPPSARNANTGKSGVLELVFVFLMYVPIFGRAFIFADFFFFLL